MNCIYNLWIFDIIFMSLFSFLLLKTKLYKHQYVSMITIICLGLLLNVVEYFKHNDVENELNFFEIFMKFLSEICLSLINYDIYDFLVFLSSTISNVFYNIVIFVTCNYFTPCHILITSIIKEIYNNLNTDGNISLNFLTFFILILIALMFLVFIEIIEINFFNVSYNTKRNIELRSLSDFDITLNNIQAPQEDLLMGGDVVSISDNN